MGEEEEGARQQESHVDVSLFETKEARFRGVYKVFASTIFAAICLIWVYRVANIPTVASGRWTWISVMVSELCFGIYWIITQSVRWRILQQTPFKHTLSQRLLSLHPLRPFTFSFPGQNIKHTHTYTAFLLSFFLTLVVSFLDFSHFLHFYSYTLKLDE